jgi:DNA-binding transcriptional ArsR family regulator
MANALDALCVLGDPTRRKIFERVAERPRSVGELARGLPVSRPAVSQHLRALKAAGLIHDRAEGTRRIYGVDPRGLSAIRTWLEGFWEKSLRSLEAEAERIEKTKGGER